MLSSRYILIIFGSRILMIFHSIPFIYLTRLGPLIVLMNTLIRIKENFIQAHSDPSLLIAMKTILASPIPFVPLASITQ